MIQIVKKQYKFIDLRCYLGKEILNRASWFLGGKLIPRRREKKIKRKAWVKAVLMESGEKGEGTSCSQKT